MIEDKKKPGIDANDVGLQVNCHFAAATPESYSETVARSITKLPRRGSQRAIILDLLRDNSGDWVGVHKLMREARSCAVHSQVAALRELFACDIRNKMERSKDGVTLSYYRLVEGGKNQ